MSIELRREPNNPHDSNAVAVHVKVPRLRGLLGARLMQVGYIKATTAKSLAKALDSGTAITGYIKYLNASDDRKFPRITLEITDED